MIFCYLFFRMSDMGRFAILLAAIRACAVSLSAQQIKVPQVTKTVRDPSGAPIGNAEVHLLKPQQIVMRAVLSDDRGQYRIDDIPPGSYVITVTRSGRAFTGRLKYSF